MEASKLKMEAMRIKNEARRRNDKVFPNREPPPCDLKKR
jgi:hypothetical protein